MSSFFVYVLKSEKDGRLYKGMTDDLERRIKEHQAGKTKSTKGFCPWKLVYTEEYNSIEQAREREKYFKTGEGRDFLKSMHL